MQECSAVAEEKRPQYADILNPTMKKKHTFVICAYNESPYLEECVKSVVVQNDYSEIILSTSTPNEYIKNLCIKYSISMYVNTEKCGITQDWEYAVGQTSTPIVTIAHQDDVYYADYSETIVEEYHRRKKPLIFFSDYDEIRNGVYIKCNKLLGIKRIMLLPLQIKPFQQMKWIRRRILSFGSPICCPSVAYVPNNLPHPLFLNHFHTNEDWEAWERFSGMDGEFVYIHRPLMAHRIHVDSETSLRIDEGGRSEEDYEMYLKFWPKPIARLLTKLYKASEKSNWVL